MRKMALSCLKNSRLTPTRLMPALLVGEALLEGGRAGVGGAERLLDFAGAVAVKYLRCDSNVAAGVGVMTTRATRPRDGTSSS